MPQTNPFHAVVPRKLTDSELATAIRLNIEAEMDAINLYAAHLEATDHPEARAILRHVMDEEREHAALFWQLIRRLDPEQGKHDDEAVEKFRLIISGASKEAVERGGEGGGEGPAPAPAPLDQMTVGALK